jgi:[ribulose-bisphosphate carboxylase]-lysine N-methyltransferase
LEPIFEADVWSFMCAPVSQANEAAVAATAAAGLRAALAAYPTTIEDDLAALRGGDLERGSRAELAVRARLGEMEALDGALAWFEARAGDLNELEYYQERRLKRLGLLDDDGKKSTTYDSFFQDGIA